MRLFKVLTGAFALGVVSIASSPLMAQPTAQNWTGFYIGGNAGGTFEPDSLTFSGGGQIGYNWQFHRSWMLGIEADLQTAKIGRQASSSQAFPTSVPGAPFVCRLNTPNVPRTAVPDGFIDLADPTNRLAGFLRATIGASAITSPQQCLSFFDATPSVRATLTGAFGAAAPTLSLTTSPSAVSYDLSGALDWFGTLRGRLGFEPLNGLLVYATGGLAYGEVHLAFATTTATTTRGLSNFIPATTTFSTFTSMSEKMLFGYAIGGGLEYALGRNWSMKGEYLYVDLGQAGMGGHSVSFNTSVARFGINYRL